MNKQKIVSLSLIILVSFIFAASGLFKLVSSAQDPEMAKGIGGATNVIILGILELLMVVLFLVKRTALVGALMMIAYMGGAMAVHLTTGQSMLAPTLIQVFVWIVAAYRFPELTQRLLGKE